MGDDGRKNRDRKEREHSTFTAHQENQPAIHRKWESDWERGEARCLEIMREDDGSQGLFENCTFTGNFYF